MKIKNCKFLGKGNEGEVYTDGIYVFKVIKDLRNVDFLQRIDLNSDFFIPIESIYKENDFFVIKYKFYDFEKVDFLEEDEAINFGVECWHKKIICKNIKTENFIRVDRQLKFIDYGNDIVEYNDNLFLNMLARLYIDTKKDISEIEKKKLKRETINNFESLDGLQTFINKVFSRIIYSFYTEKDLEIDEIVLKEKSNEELAKEILKNEKRKFLIHSFDKLNFEKLYWKLLRGGKRIINIKPLKLKEVFKNNVFYKIPEVYLLEIEKAKKTFDNVTLLIKTCAQEYRNIDKQIKHILKQLLFPNQFGKILVLVDVKKEDFLREYDKGNWDVLIRKLDILKEEKLIDDYFYIPEDKIKDTNKKWFNIEINETHTITNAPVISQLYAFEKIKTPYILQLDSDVLIGRKDYNHSFLEDMINELEKNENVLSVGFNIPKKEEKFYEYFGFENGGYVPEVRFALIHKERLLNFRPLPNEIVNGKLRYTWHRSVEKKQKQTNKVSIRGGDYRSYFIHPQNFRKECPDVWMSILDRIEKGILLEKQKEEYELVGSYYEWCVPKRNEEVVIVTVVRNASYETFLRCWISVLSQDYKNFGWIIIDDNSDNGLSFFIENLISNNNLKEKITFISNRVRSYSLGNIYKAIHYFCGNENSIIVLLDGDDAFIGNDVLSNLKRYYDEGADVVIGKMYRTDKLYPIYRYPPDFENPRKNNGGNVYQHLKTFRKYLFDSIKVWDLKIENNKKNVGAKKEWIKFATDYAIMIPIVEMASKPVFYDKYNYFHQRSLPSNSKMKKIKDKYIGYILNKKSYSKKDVILGRRDFYPNTNRIEIDILYKCNLKCLSCNRSSAQVDRDDYISIKTIENFIQESIELSKNWELINILGGEPTLHPDFFEIVNLLLEYIEKYSPKTILQITSNGYTKESREMLSKLKHPNIYIDTKSFKTSNKIDYFTPFNDAPIDDDRFKNEDFSKGCWVASYCGMGLNKYGYYPCGVIGSIDRLFGGLNGKKSIREFKNDKVFQKEIMDKYCGLCGNFKYYSENKGDFIPRCEKDYFKNDIVSYTWKYLYKNRGKI